MNTNTRISCDLHDYVEIACLFSYELRLTLRDGGNVVGNAKDTRTSSDRVEYLILDTDSDRIEIAMREIAHIAVLTPGARFNEVSFSSPDDAD